MELKDAGITCNVKKICGPVYRKSVHMYNTLSYTLTLAAEETKRRPKL